MSSDTEAAKAYIEAAQQQLDLALEALEGTGPAPPLYAGAIQDRDPRPKPALPVLGLAGSHVTDPTFGTRLTRVTDATQGGSWHVASNAHVASWNADASLFYLLGPDGKQVFKLVDGEAWPFARVSSQCEPTFSRTDPANLYGVGGPATRTIQVTILGLEGVVRVQDLLDLDTLGLGLAAPRTYVGGMVTSDVSIAFFFGGQGQDDHHYAAVLEADGNLRQVDTRPLGFKLHSISIDRTGRFAVLYPVQAKPHHMVIWDLEQMTFTPVTEAPWGHDTQGYGIEINHDCSPAQPWDAAQWQLRALDHLDQSADLITPVLRPKEVYLDDHASYHNARPDVHLPVCTATYRYNNEAVEWRAWDDEVIAFTIDGPCVVYRFCHHRSDCRDEGNSAGTYFWYQPIPSISPDGRYVLFGSNWEKTLGADPQDHGRSRTDVFLARLPT